MEAAVTKVLHSLALEDDTIWKIQVEAREKSAQSFCNYSEVGRHKTEPTIKLENFTVGNDSTQEQ